MKPAATPDVSDADGLNAMLDMIEQNIATAIDLGLEVPLRNRLARLLPPGQGPAKVAGAAPISVERRLDLTAALVGLRETQRFKLTHGAHGAMARLREFILAELEGAGPCQK